MPARRLVGDLQLAGVRSKPEVHAADRHGVIGRAGRVPAAVVAAVGGIDPVVEPPGQPVDVVLRVADREPGEQRLAAVGDVVAVGVLEKEDVGRRGHQHAATPGQDRGRMLKPGGEERHRFVVAVAVGVVEQLHPAERPRPLGTHRVVSHLDHVHPAVGVEGNRYRVHDVRFTCSELEPQSLGEPGGGDELVRVERRAFAVAAGAAKGQREGQCGHQGASGDDAHGVGLRCDDGTHRSQKSEAGCGLMASGSPDRRDTPG